MHTSDSFLNAVAASCAAQNILLEGRWQFVEKAFQAMVWSGDSSVKAVAASCAAQNVEMRAQTECVGTLETMV